MKRLSIVLLAACAPPVTGLPPTVHPTASASQTSVGMSLGVAYTLDETDEGQDDNAQLVVPWGEGWARWGMGSGQLELHVLPGLGSVGYRIDLGPGFALVPSGHAALYYAWNEDGLGDESNGGLLLLGAGLTGIITVPTGQGFFYVAPRLAITNGRLLGDDLGDTDSSNLLTLAAAVGIDFGGPGIGMSLELAIQRSSDLDSDSGFEPLWIVAPTLGLRL
jgi:hypothetical protein